MVTISPDESSVVEGSDLSFTLTAVPPPASALPVTLSWSDPGSFLAETLPRTVTIPTDGEFKRWRRPTKTPTTSRTAK